MVNPAGHSMVIHPEDARHVGAVASLAQRWGFALDAIVSEAKPQAKRDATEDAPPTLWLGDAGLELRDTATKPGRGLRVDFSHLSPRTAARRGLLSHNQLLAKAVGKNASAVIDATAGMGQDAALLATLGYTVLAIERSVIIAALLEDGLRRAEADPALAKAFGGRLSIRHADARDVIVATPVDAICIDPMFPPKRKASALAKKSIRMVRDIVGDDGDSAELLAKARQFCHRVIVKRPTHAEPIAEAPTMHFAGKLVRYDVYLR